MFAMKSMDRNSSLLRLKLEMVYRDLAEEEARKRFDELNVPVATAEVAPAAEPLPPAVVIDAPKKKRKVIPIVPAGVPAAAAPAKRAMSEDARTALSERMKKQWADKKANNPPKAVLPAPK